MRVRGTVAPRELRRAGRGEQRGGVAWGGVEWDGCVSLAAGSPAVPMRAHVVW